MLAKQQNLNVLVNQIVTFHKSNHFSLYFFNKFQFIEKKIPLIIYLYTFSQTSKFIYTKKFYQIISFNTS